MQPQKIRKGSCIIMIRPMVNILLDKLSTENTEIYLL